MNDGCLIVFIDTNLTKDEKIKLYEFILDYKVPRPILILDKTKRKIR
jgi:hypothetical protein